MSQEAKVLTGIGLVSILLIVGAVIFLSKSSPTPQNVISDSKLLVKSDSHVLGSNQAKVTIVEFGDYQCPACGAAYPVTKQIIKDYGAKIKFVFRNFPLTQHQNAKVAAEAAEAAGTQGKFWEMHDILYEKQSEWGQSSDPMPFFLDYAKKVGLNVSKFEEDVKGDKFVGKINTDANDGSSLGVNVTPTFFINGEKVEGVLSYSEFKKRIEK